MKQSQRMGLKKITMMGVALAMGSQADGFPNQGGSSEASFATEAWSLMLATYSPLMGLEGDVGAGGVAVPVDLSFKDILEELDGGAVLALEAKRDRWSIGADFIWLKLSSSEEPFAETRINFRQQEFISSLTFGYELYGNPCSSIELLAGGAMTSIDVDLEVFTPRLQVTYREGGGSQTWIDPFVGLRGTYQFSERWSVWFRADIGGFGVSSDEYWQAVGGISCRLGERVSLGVAYRVIATDYQQGGFRYDTKMAGPNLGLVFHF
jgi:hypothetical protein